MRPSDPAVRAQLAPARGPLAGVLAGSCVSALLVTAQAFAISAFVVAALDGQHVLVWGLVAGAVMGGRALANLVVDLFAARAATVVGLDMRRRVLESAISQGQHASSGEVAALVTRGVAAAEPYLTRYVPALVLASVLPILTVVAMATQDVMSAVIVLATLPLVPVFGALVGLATRDRAEAQWRAMASLSGHFLDVMKGLPTLVAFRRAKAQSATIRAITDRYRKSTLETLRIAFASSAVLELVATLSVALVAVVVGVRLASGELELRTALVVLLLAPEAYWPLRRVGAEFHAAAEGVATYEKLSALPLGPQDAEVRTRLRGPVEVDGLSVVYSGRSAPAFAHVRATFPARGLTAVVGASGSGKSTLLAALAGLVPISAGTIRVGGRDVGGPGWQSQISWVPQRPSFVDGSVAENLRLAAPDATDAELWCALAKVALEERVRDLPGGLDGAVGEDAKNLSAGERARLALARVVVAGRPWVFLDEPTAHLDAVTEQIIADTLVDLAKTSGVVVVAHREALVQLADHVVALALPVPHRPACAAQPAVAARLHPVTTDVIVPRRGFGVSTVLGALASASGAALTATAGWLIVKASEQPPVLTMLVAIVGVRAFGLARPVLRYVERLRSHDAALRLLAERRVQVYDAVVPLTPGRLGRRRGDALASIVDDVESVVDRQLRVRMPVRGLVIVAALACLVAWSLLPAAGLVVASTCLVGGGLAAAIAWLGSRAPERAALAARADLSAKVVETIQLGPELVMWQAQTRAMNAVLEAATALARASVKAARALALGRAAGLLAGAAGVVLMGVIGSGARDAGQLSGPMLALLMLLPLALVEVMLPLADAGALARRTHAADDRLRELESTEPLVSDGSAPDALPSSHQVGARRIAAGWGADEVLRDLSLDLPQGARLGVVGPSGSGKSTLAALLLRFLDPRAGEVRLGDVPLERLALDDVRRTVGLVDDDPHVFATTVAENVRLARPEATDGELDAALRRAQLGEWLDGLPEGLQTWLGDGHSQISGGERARLAVARSLLADPPVLVLDEPTANLDSATAEAVARDVLAVAGERSVVWITHGRVGLDEMDEVLDLGA